MSCKPRRRVARRPELENISEEDEEPEALSYFSDDSDSVYSQDSVSLSNVPSLEEDEVSCESLLEQTIPSITIDTCPDARISVALPSDTSLAYLQPEADIVPLLLPRKEYLQVPVPGATGPADTKDNYTSANAGISNVTGKKFTLTKPPPKAAKAVKAMPKRAFEAPRPAPKPPVGNSRPRGKETVTTPPPASALRDRRRPLAVRPDAVPPKPQPRPSPSTRGAVKPKAAPPAARPARPSGIRPAATSVKKDPAPATRQPLCKVRANGVPRAQQWK